MSGDTPSAARDLNKSWWIILQYAYRVFSPDFVQETARTVFAAEAYNKTTRAVWLRDFFTLNPFVKTVWALSLDFKEGKVLPPCSRVGAAT